MYVSAQVGLRFCLVILQMKSEGYENLWAPSSIPQLTSVKILSLCALWFGRNCTAVGLAFLSRDPSNEVGGVRKFTCTVGNTTTNFCKNFVSLRSVVLEKLYGGRKKKKNRGDS